MSEDRTSPAVQPVLTDRNPTGRSSANRATSRSATDWVCLCASAAALLVAFNLRTLPLVAAFLLACALPLVALGRRRSRDSIWRRFWQLTDDLPAPLAENVRALASPDLPTSILPAIKSCLDASRDEWEQFLSLPEAREWNDRLRDISFDLDSQSANFWDDIPLGDSQLKPWLSMLSDEPWSILTVAACDGRAPLPVDLLRTISAHRSKRLRSMAMEDLARHSCPGSLDLILALLVESSDLHVRRAVSALLAARNDSNIEEVIAIALVDEDPVVRAHAVRALRGRRESAKLVFLLEGALLDSEAIRQQAIEALASCSSDRAMALLASALEDNASSVRWSAMLGLSQHEQCRVLRYLNEGQLAIYRAMRDDRSSWMREHR